VTDPLYPVLATEWVLLPRTTKTDDFKKKMHQLTSKKTRALIVDVTTMYEIASDILKLEAALNLITLVAVLILFFIILMGVINTLRMTIRERTREIGTMRAIGMQKTDVRNAFILETFFLAVFSSMIGVIAAFLIMGALARMPLDLQDNPLGMFLVDGHLYFMPTLGGILSNVMLILVIAVVTAYFPAKRAANLKAAVAFRHYE
jgi:putative ABC transport system permease protein